MVLLAATFTAEQAAQLNQIGYMMIACIFAPMIFVPLMMWFGRDK